MLAPLYSQSQEINRVSGSVITPPSFVGPLDGYETDLIVAAMPFRGFTAYVGNWLRLRETLGSTEADIGFNADGTPNTTAWAAHVGAGSGFIPIWYDQSSGIRNIIQATSGLQPQSVLNVVNGMPVARMDGIDDVMSTAVGTSTLRTLYVVMRKRSAPLGVAPLYAAGFNSTSAFAVDSNTTPLSGGFGWRGSGTSTMVALGGDCQNWSLGCIVVASAAAAAAYINNGTASSFDPANSVTTQTNLQVGIAGVFADVDVAAILLYHAAHDDTTRQAIQTILGAKFGIII